jgi:hypothetical protein
MEYPNGLTVGKVQIRPPNKIEPCFPAICRVSTHFRESFQGPKSILAVERRNDAVSDPNEEEKYRELSRRRQRSAHIQLCFVILGNGFYLR